MLLERTVLEINVRVDLVDEFDLLIITILL